MRVTKYITLSFQPVILAREAPPNLTVQIEHGISGTKTQNVTKASIATAEPPVKELKDTHDAYSIYFHTRRLQPA